MISANTIRLQRTLARTKANVMAEEEGVRLYKIVLAGDLGVGKTSIFQRYDINKFFENKESTFGLDKLTKDVTVDGKRCKVSCIEAIRIHLMSQH